MDRISNFWCVTIRETISYIARHEVVAFGSNTLKFGIWREIILVLTIPTAMQCFVFSLSSISSSYLIELIALLFLL